MGSQREIDDAIDRAVRDIMSVEPRAGLRSRVLDRLERPAAGWFALARLAGAAALLVIVAIAFLMIPPAPRPVAPPTIASSAPAPAPPSVPPPAVAPPYAGVPADSAPTRRVRPPQPPRAPVQPSRPLFPAQGVVAAASVAGDSTAALETIEPVAPLPVAAGASPIAIQAIQIEPLTIERIVVAPIPPPR